MSRLGHNNPPPPDQNGGWVAIRRAMRSHWLVGFGQPVKPCDPEKGSYSRTEAWIDLIMECRYEDGTVNNNGRKMRLERGQLLGAVSWLAARWNWTPKTVRGFLDRLEQEAMIQRFDPRPEQFQGDPKPGPQKGRFANLVTVCNYALYQLLDKQEGQVERPVEGQLRAGSGPVEGNIYKDNKGTRKTKEQGNKATAFGGLDPREFEKQLLDACNGALDNPVNCSGLLSLAEPQMWLEQGCDLQKDILPTLKAVGTKAHGKRIKTWTYFSGAVADAKKAREKGLVTFNENGELETKSDRLMRYAIEAEQQLKSKEFRK